MFDVLTVGVNERLLAGMEFHPRNGAADAYLYDLDGSERHVRTRTGIDKFPRHDNPGSFAKLGSMNPLLCLFNGAVWGQMWGKVPFGPIMSAVPDNLQWQIMVPGLNKQLPQY